MIVTSVQLVFLRWINWHPLFVVVVDTVFLPLVSIAIYVARLLTIVSIHRLVAPRCAYYPLFVHIHIIVVSLASGNHRCQKLVPTFSKKLTSCSWNGIGVPISDDRCSFRLRLPVLLQHCGSERVNPIGNHLQWQVAIHSAIRVRCFIETLGRNVGELFRGIFHFLP